jgi:hypothetical protein
MQQSRTHDLALKIRHQLVASTAGFMYSMYIVYVHHVLVRVQ